MTLTFFPPSALTLQPNGLLGVDLAWQPAVGASSNYTITVHAGAVTLLNNAAVFPQPAGAPLSVLVGNLPYNSHVTWSVHYTTGFPSATQHTDAGPSFDTPAPIANELPSGLALAGDGQVHVTQDADGTFAQWVQWDVHQNDRQYLVSRFYSQGGVGHSDQSFELATGPIGGKQTFALNRLPIGAQVRWYINTVYADGTISAPSADGPSFTLPVPGQSPNNPGSGIANMRIL